MKRSKNETQDNIGKHLTGVSNDPFPIVKENKTKNKKDKLTLKFDDDSANPKGSKGAQHKNTEHNTRILYARTDYFIIRSLIETRI